MNRQEHHVNDPSREPYQRTAKSNMSKPRQEHHANDPSRAPCQRPVKRTMSMTRQEHHVHRVSQPCPSSCSQHPSRSFTEKIHGRGTGRRGGGKGEVRTLPDRGRSSPQAARYTHSTATLRGNTGKHADIHNFTGTVWRSKANEKKKKWAGCGAIKRTINKSTATVRRNMTKQKKKQPPCEATMRKKTRNQPATSGTRERTKRSTVTVRDKKPKKKRATVRRQGEQKVNPRAACGAMHQANKKKKYGHPACGVHTKAATVRRN